MTDQPTQRRFRWLGDVVILAAIIAIAFGISRLRAHDRFLDHRQDELMYGTGVDKTTAKRLQAVLIELGLFSGSKAHAYTDFVPAGKENIPQGHIFDERHKSPAVDHDHYELRFAIVKEALYPPASAHPRVQQAAANMRAQAVEQCRQIQHKAFNDKPLVVLMVDKQSRVIDILCELQSPQ